MPDDLREELQKRAAAVRAIPSTHYPFVLPDELQGYHSIIPLDDPTSLMPGPGQERRKFWNWLSSVYKGTSEKDGIVYTLRRIESASVHFEKLDPWLRSTNQTSGSRVRKVSHLWRRGHVYAIQTLSLSTRDSRRGHLETTVRYPILIQRSHSSP